MIRRALLLAFLSVAWAAAAFGQTRVYRIDLVSGGVLWSDDQPMQSGEQILFHGRPAGSLKSLRRADIKRIVVLTTAMPAPNAIRPGESVDVGMTAGGARGRAGTGGTPGRSAGAQAGLRPGEGKGGTALFNPERPYRPDWDGKLVPGATLGLPNSANDYREGSTLAHPAATARQAAPGEVPRAPNQ